MLDYPTCNLDIQIRSIHAMQVKVEPGLPVNFGWIQTFATDADAATVNHIKMKWWSWNTLQH